RHWNDQKLAFAGSIADLVAMARTAAIHRDRAEQLAQQAYFDPLTGLMNWQYLQDRLHQEVAEARAEGKHLALYYIDLDRFLYLNDTLGHSTGDRILVDVAEALAAIQPAEALLGRVGGDEFVLIARNLEPEEVETLAERIRQHISELVSGDQGVSLSASIGVAVMDDTSREAGELLAGADLACRQAKEAGRNRWALYRPSEGPEALMSERLALFHRIRRALSEDGFALHFQPIVDLQDAEEETHECGACGEGLHTDHEACPECGADRVRPIE
ncbi:MAG: diguanylate cyclase domain-containing protein, partial [Thiohalorhabdaceae bacterium]